MKLIDIPVVFICPDHNEKYHSRKVHTVELLNKIGFKTIIHHKSGNESYPKCLVKANIDVLTQYLNDSPVIIIEDDVELFLDLNSETEFDMPEDTDAFYLGFSKSGGHKTLNSHDGWSQVQMISNKHIRILNMLTTHAILYKSKSYKQRVIQELGKVLENPSYYNDVVLARLHPLYKIYGYYYPLFYQSVKWGNVQHTEDYTKFKFNSQLRFV
jgi:hypothetical protein